MGKNNKNVRKYDGQGAPAVGEIIEWRGKTYSIKYCDCNPLCYTRLACTDEGETDEVLNYLINAQAPDPTEAEVKARYEALSPADKKKIEEAAMEQAAEELAMIIVAASIAAAMNQSRRSRG